MALNVNDLNGLYMYYTNKRKRGAMKKQTQPNKFEAIFKLVLFSLRNAIIFTNITAYIAHDIIKACKKAKISTDSYSLSSCDIETHDVINPNIDGIKNPALSYLFLTYLSSKITSINVINYIYVRHTTIITIEKNNKTYIIYLRFDINDFYHQIMYVHYKDINKICRMRSLPYSVKIEIYTDEKNRFDQPFNLLHRKELAYIIKSSKKYLKRKNIQKDPSIYNEVVMEIANKLNDFYMDNPEP